MLDLQSIKAQDLKGLSLTELGVMVPQLLSYIDEQSNHIGEQRKRIDSAQQAIKWRDAKIEKIMFELARLKAWKFGAKSERMTAEQRELFAEALAADQASLEEQLAALQATANQPPASSEPAPKRKPKREPLPQHLPRVDHRVEPENTMCECGQAMERVGEDVSERLDIVPAKFFVQRQIRGKWACKCCQLLLQEPAAAQVFDNGLPTPGLQAHTVISRFVDHLPYYRQEQINARSGVHTPRATLAGWAGHTGAQLMPLFEAHKDFVLGSRVLHGDETTVGLLDPGAGKTKTAYMWAYARRLRSLSRSCLRLLHRSRRPIPLPVPRRLDRHTGSRRLRRLREGPVAERSVRRRMHGSLSRAPFYPERLALWRAHAQETSAG